MEKKTVYEYPSRRVAFEGTADECWTWLMKQAFTTESGFKIYRTWKEDGDRIYDVGSVYIFNN